ncbi:hypothetical protein WJX84_012387 [Apatococcus fuscideae]|uniref:beta-mannosidase n=1 Tax=Apatococcus fuscideae TaxID=2026836 RepID=A0AAW1SWV6_9CHLO
MQPRWRQLLFALASWLMLSLARSENFAYDLLTDQWLLSQVDGSIESAVQLPASSLEALEKQDLVQSSLYRDNELQNRWVSESTWRFQRSFHVSEDAQDHTNVDLLLGGLDTMAHVVLNGQGPIPASFQDAGDDVILRSQNGHRRYRIPVKDLLQVGDNNISITLFPAAEEAARAADAYPYKVPSMQGPGMLPHYNFLRKTASDFGWDWGPALMPAGILGPARLEAYSTAILTGVDVRQQHLEPDDERIKTSGCSNIAGASSAMMLSFECEVIVPEGAPESTLQVAGPPEMCSSSSKAVSIAGPGQRLVTYKVIVQQLPNNTWWPRGYGDQPLLDFVVSLALADTADNGERGLKTSQMMRRVGLKTVELVRQPVQHQPDKETFFFRINGVDVYAKGTNLIPMDVFQSVSAMRR